MWIIYYKIISHGESKKKYISYDNKLSEFIMWIDG